MLEDVEISKITDVELKNLSINSYYCLKENGKKINYMQYIRKMENKDCNDAILRVFNNIKIEEINAFIDNIEKMETIRKEFYKKLIKNRYDIIKNVFEKLENLVYKTRNLLYNVTR